jgi:hypothetical protein
MILGTNNMKTKILIVISTLLFPLYLQAYELSRADLLDEGRRSVNTLIEYNRISGMPYKGFVELSANSYFPYSVDSNQGADDAGVVFGALSFKYDISKTFTFYTIANYYAIFSLNKRSAVTNDSGSLDLKDGQASFRNILGTYIH